MALAEPHLAAWDSQRQAQRRRQHRNARAGLPEDAFRIGGDRDRPRPQITQISSKNGVYWGFGVQMYANPSKNEPRGAG